MTNILKCAEVATRFKLSSGQLAKLGMTLGLIGEGAAAQRRGDEEAVKAIKKRIDEIVPGLLRPDWPYFEPDK